MGCGCGCDCGRGRGWMAMGAVVATGASSGSMRLMSGAGGRVLWAAGAGRREWTDGVGADVASGARWFVLRADLFCSLTRLLDANANNGRFLLCCSCFRRRFRCFCLFALATDASDTGCAAFLSCCFVVVSRCRRQNHSPTDGSLPPCAALLLRPLLRALRCPFVALLCVSVCVLRPCARLSFGWRDALLRLLCLLGLGLCLGAAARGVAAAGRGGMTARGGRATKQRCGGREQRSKEADARGNGSTKQEGEPQIDRQSRR